MNFIERLCAFLRPKNGRPRRRSFFEPALEAGAVGLFELDLDTGMVCGSPLFFQQLGISAGAGEAITRERWLATVHPQDLELLAHDLQQAISATATHGPTHRQLQSSGRYNVEYRILRPDGALLWIEGAGRLVTDGAGGSPTDGKRAVQRILGITLDVTRRKQAELALIEATARGAEDAVRTRLAGAEAGLSTTAAPETGNPTHQPEPAPGRSATPPPVDLEALNELAGGDVAFIRELLATFISSSEATLMKIATAQETSDLPALRRNAHSLKGAASNCCADQLAAAAGALEQLAANADHAGCRAAAEQVREQFQRTTAYLGSVAP